MKKLVTVLLFFCLGQVSYADQDQLVRTDLGFENPHASPMKEDRNQRRRQAFEQNSTIITIGYGVPNLGKAIFNIYKDELGFYTSGIGPIHAKYEFGLTDHFGIGVSIGFVDFKAAWLTKYHNANNELQEYEEGFKGSSFGIMARGNYHFSTSKRLDPFVGFGIGYNRMSFGWFSEYEYADELSLSFPIPFATELSIGARYYLSDNIGAYAELGWGKSLLQAGLSMKF